MPEKYAAEGWQLNDQQASVTAKTLWLELGHLRALVNEADRLRMPDTAVVTATKVDASGDRVGEYRLGKLLARSRAVRESGGSGNA